MGGIRRVVRASAWILAGILGASVFLYLILLAVNWRDRPPSDAVLRARTLIESRPQVPASDNAYVYILGFSAPDEADPQQAGEARFSWIEARGYTPESGSPDPVPDRNLRAKRPERFQQLLRSCNATTRSCAVAIEQSMHELAGALDPNDIVLVRYGRLLERTAWHEPVPFEAGMPMPMYSNVLDGQRLYMAALWRASGDSSAIRDGLQRDIAFWRTVLRSSDLLISKSLRWQRYGNTLRTAMSCFGE